MLPWEEQVVRVRPLCASDRAGSAVSSAIAPDEALAKVLAAARQAMGGEAALAHLPVLPIRADRCVSHTHDVSI
jgi:hypothetical protein